MKSKDYKVHAKLIRKGRAQILTYRIMDFFPRARLGEYKGITNKIIVYSVGGSQTVVRFSGNARRYPLELSPVSSCTHKKT